MVRYQHIKTQTYRILNLTSLTVDEFEQLVPPFEAGFVRHMRDWTMEGKPRTGRRYSQYTSCPLPTPEDRLLFILSYLKVAALHVAHGTMFAMSLMLQIIAQLTFPPNTRLQRTPLRVEQDRAFFSVSFCYNDFAMYRWRRR